MSKYLKSLITACLVVCMTVCLGIFAAACTKNPDSGNGGDDNDFTYPSSINVTVLLDDGTPASGVSVQLCTVSDDGTADSANCKLPRATNDQGVASTNVKESDGFKFEVHILNIPETYYYYSYVDANGNPYAAGTGARIDVRESANVTVKLAIVSVTDKISEGSNTVKLAAITDTLKVKADIESAGWYKLAATNAFLLSGTGFALTNDNNEVNIYLKPNDELTFSFTDENELVFTLGLTAHEADGTAAKPLPALLGSQYVIPLEANKTVYITNNTINGKVVSALDVSGTNFKANYESTDYTEAFTLKAPTSTVPQTFSVGTADGAAGVVTLYFGEHVDKTLGSENNPYIAELGVAVTVEYDGGEPVWVSFTASEEGNYTFSYSADSCIMAGNGEFDLVESDNAGSFSVTLTANQVVKFNVSSKSWDPASLSITITK